LMRLVRQSAFLFFLLCLGCSASLLHYYDPTTYKNLTDLKPEVTALYESFIEEEIDKKAIAAIRLKLAQVFEYEKGKGENNHETARQIELIRKMFGEHVQERLKNGKWSEPNLQNKKENIEDAFDIAISTERLKNKNE
jgi:hypothetical protein